jgi:hypothetical protein
MTELTGGGAIRDHEGRDEDSSTIAVSHYIVPVRIGSSGNLSTAREALPIFPYHIAYMIQYISMREVCTAVNDTLALTVS